MQNQNVAYALDAVRAARRFGCSVFVGTGSQAEYGCVEGVLRPDTPAFPENGYGMGKLCAGLMTRELAGQLGLRHIWVRVLSVYGPCDGENSMIMSAIRKLLAGETPEFTKGEQMWDYLYSTRQWESKAPGRIYFGASGYHISRRRSKAWRCTICCGAGDALAG